MRTALDARPSTGYGSRERRGFHGVLDVETALAAAQTAARLRDVTAVGEKISGPAARRAIAGAASMPSFEGALTTPKAAAKFLERDGLVLFDNPDAFLIRAFKRDTALRDRVHAGPGRGFYLAEEFGAVEAARPHATTRVHSTSRSRVEVPWDGHPVACTPEMGGVTGVGSPEVVVLSATDLVQVSLGLVRAQPWPVRRGVGVEG
ncbi:hypothetical protein [Streptomyces apocyni]|uniref:hypothetical protein n=1 Tax=Streptomyces apocyni TaxID=2654677 RepID=UPI0012E9CA25|nr:hypothetical protein [Streptomyces apocyni]